MEKKIIYLILFGLFIIILLTAVFLDNTSKKIYTEIYGTVSLKGELFCPCFLVGDIEVWYDLIEGRPATDISNINNGDFVVIRGEYVNDQFWVAEISKAVKCTEESKNADVCMAVYTPVCGMPINQTFNNSCLACISSGVIYYFEGECP